MNRKFPEVGARVKITWGALTGTFGTFAGVREDDWPTVTIENPYSPERSIVTVPLRADAFVEVP